MAALLGATTGAGLFLVWWSFWESPPRERRRRTPGRVADLLAAAGVEKVSPGGLAGSCIALCLFVVLVFVAATSSWAMAVCFGLFSGWFPVTILRWRAKKRAALLRQLWPDVVDHLRSAIRAGLPLPEALIQLGSKGPEELRPIFRDFGADYRAGGKFDVALNRLKDRLADPVADRIIEALRLTREVGGSDLGKLLGTLAEFLRESARTRSELEARQSWTINAARLAVAAPWIVMLLLATRPEAVQAYNTPAGAAVLLGGLVISLVCYSIMLRIGALPRDERVLR
ncbi:type II secretion system F family protein [Arthrobacter sp. BHU FT2]|nr:type II secretion system F family protein [Arthrobacter sp. BHU FT2]